MAAFNDLKTETKLIGAFLAIALIIVAVAVAGFLSLKSVNAGMATMYADRLLPAQQLGNISDAQLKIQVALYRFILVPEDRGKLKQDIARQIESADRNLRLYEATSLVPEEEQGLAGFRPAWADYQQAVAEAMRQVKAGNGTAALQSIDQGGAVFTAQRTVDRSVTDLIEIQVHIGIGLKQQGARIFDLARWMMIMTGFCGVLFAVVLGLALSRSITVPLSKITGVAGAAASGNLNMEALAGIKSRRDEIGMLAEAFTLMAGQIKGVLEGLHRLNRELRAISDCNQALLRAEDEQSLLGDICRIICEEA